MPTAKVKSSTGETTFNYTISTPSVSSASVYRQQLTDVAVHPWVLLRATDLPTSVACRQFEDPQIRKFNCVALDLRLYGRTTTDGIPEGYGVKEAAEDLALFMDEVGLPACHIVGLSMGTMLGIALAVNYPNKVASLFLVSPLGLEELAGVASGRREIADIWIEGFKTGRLDMTAISDSMYGAYQLGFNNNRNSLVRALDGISLPLALKNAVPARFEQYERGTVDFLNNRTEYSEDQLSRICVPVKLLREAGVTVSLATIPEAPHFGVVTHGDIVNWLLHDFIIDICETSVPQVPGEVSSPWEEELVKAGWNKGVNDPEDD
ncbi:alpha/beta-hydrolase [Armillaria borealis]|uniref:Alpha/beta-hydrolase n=1 Tax=Armillaria borealis TaxID=47425 RepID=A0AA39J5E4_9AGAR|nr:alpha/beta-hydrolase [Armillaria borealis]